MVSLHNWKWCAWLALLPLYACSPLQALQALQQPSQQPSQLYQACTQQAGMLTPDYCYAVAHPHVVNDYPVSYRVQAQEGRATAVDRHALEARSSALRLRDSIVK